MNRAIQQRRQQQRPNGQRRSGNRMGQHRQAIMPAGDKCKKQWVDHLLDTLSLIQEVVHSLTTPSIDAGSGMTINWLRGAKWLLELLTPRSAIVASQQTNRIVNHGKGTSTEGKVNIWKKDFEYVGAGQRGSSGQQRQLSFEGSVYR